MLAAVLEENNSCLVIKDVPVPEINDNEVLLKVKACGVCHTDLHYIDHGIKTFKSPPIILGHEASGIIEKIGPAVDNFKKGDRVLVPAVITCGSCKFCKTSRENICLNMQMLGNHINGAYAEYLAVNSKDVQKIPDDLSFEEAALISDALSTAYHAVFNRAKVEKNSNVVVFGCGGVGISIVQMAVLKGAKVIAIDINNSKLSLARDFGATVTIDPEQQNIFEALKKEASTGVDVIFEVVGLSSNFELAMKLANPGTKICIVGYITEKAKINCAKLMFYELDIIGSLGCKPSDLSEIVDMVRQNKINARKMVSNKYSIDQINIALDDLRNSRGLRPVITFE
ncbi:MAG: zinc-binding dehydrogenase [Cyanobacteriota bacterium]